MSNLENNNMPEYHKTLVELINYGRMYDGYYILPTRIDTNGRDCEVEFSVMDKYNKKKTVIRRGHYYDDIFTTKINNIPLVLNVRTNVLKRKRSEREDREKVAREKNTSSIGNSSLTNKLSNGNYTLKVKK